MTGQEIIGIIGLLATIIFGGLSIYLVITRRYPDQITFIREDAIALFDTIVKNSSELSIEYNKQPISERLVLLKAAFINTGSKDITSEMTHEPLSLSVPKGFHFHTVKVVSHSSQTRGRIKQDGQQIEFHMKLFRCKEYVRFEAMAEVPELETVKSKNNNCDFPDHRLINSLKISHRIVDTAPVRTVDFPNQTVTNKRAKMIGIPLICIFAISIVLLCNTYFRPPTKIQYTINENGNNIPIDAQPRTDGTITIKGREDNNYNKTLPVEDFFAQGDLQVKIVVDQKKYIKLLGTSLVYLLLAGSFAAYIYKDVMSAKRLRKLLHLPKVQD